MPLFFRTSLNFLGDKFSILVLLNIFFKKKHVFAFSIVLHKVVRNRCIILLLANIIYIRFDYAIKYLYICHILVNLHLKIALNILLMTLFKFKHAKKKFYETTFLIFNSLTKLPRN